MKTTVKKHKPTGALVWFPNDGRHGIVVRDGRPWKYGMVYSSWEISDLEGTEYEIEIKLKQK